MGDATAAGRGATVVDAWPPGCWVATTPTTTGWFGPLVDELVGTGWGSRARTVAAGGWSGNGRNGEWIVGPPSRVLISRQTYPTAGTTTITPATRNLRNRRPDPSTKTGLCSGGVGLLPVMTHKGYARPCGRPQLSGYAQPWPTSGRWSSGWLVGRSHTPQADPVVSCRPSTVPIAEPPTRTPQVRRRAPQRCPVKDPPGEDSRTRTSYGTPTLAVASSPRRTRLGHRHEPGTPTRRRHEIGTPTRNPDSCTCPPRNSTAARRAVFSSMEVHLLQGEDCLCLGPARDTHDASSGRCCWSMS